MCTVCYPRRNTLNLPIYSAQIFPSEPGYYRDNCIPTLYRIVISNKLKKRSNCTDKGATRAQIPTQPNVHCYTHCTYVTYCNCFHLIECSSIYCSGEKCAWCKRLPGRGLFALSECDCILEQIVPVSIKTQSFLNSAAEILT